MYDGGRRGLPMYEVRWTMYDLGNSRAKGAGYAERQRRGRVKIMQGGNSKGLRILQSCVTGLANRTWAPLGATASPRNARELRNRTSYLVLRT